MGYEKLDQSVISDQEAQFSGDVEAPFFEMPYMAGIPPVATDKPTSRLYTDTAGHTKVRDAAGAVLDLTAGALSGGDNRDTHEDAQAVAATATTRVFRAVTPGTIEEFAAEVGVAAAAGESMTFDIQIGGVSALTAVVTIDDTTPIDTQVAGVIDTAANAYAVGDLITIVRTYVAGGAPTPMANTVATVAVKAA